MILADKIILLRKKNGWSQEELAEKMQVSRQAVSKWEGAQTVPDLDKILALSRLFGVTTDYLLKDEIEEEEVSDGADNSPVTRVSLSLANDFLEWRKRAAWRIAVATFLCILAVIPLILLCTASEVPQSPITEPLAEGIGLAVLLVFIAIAVALFVTCGLRNAPYVFLDGEPFETEYGVEGMVKERQRAYRPTYVKCNVIAAFICVLSPIPLLVGSILGDDLLTVTMLAVTMFLAGVGAVLFILSGVRWASMQKLLKEAARQRRRSGRIRGAISTVFWLTATAVYLLWSFLTGAWELSWIVWPIAGILFAATMCLCNLFLDRDIEQEK